MSWGQQSYGSYRPPQGAGGYGGPPQQQYQGPPSQYGGPPPQYGGPPPQYGGPPSQYAQQQGGYPPQQQSYPPTGGPGGPGGYGPPPPANVPPGIDPTLWEWFQSVDTDRSGQISAIELRQALLNSNWSHFNEETCRLLIGMFDKDKNGTIDVYEFGALWKYVQEWKGCFDRFDSDKSGNISCDELSTALNSFGYRLSPQFCQLCTRVFDRKDTRTMKFDDFIQCCVMLKSLTESFQRMDTDRDGVIDVQYEQFLTMIIDNRL